MASISAAMALINLGIVQLFAVGIWACVSGTHYWWAVPGTPDLVLTIKYVLCEAQVRINLEVLDRGHIT